MTERAHAEWERVYEEVAPRLWRALAAFTGDPDVASDALSEAFSQGMRRGPAVRDPAAWAWRAAFRIAAGELKERGAGVPPARFEAENAAPEDDIVEALRLVEALRRLSPKQRAALVLHHYAGFPVREVAEIIGSTGPAVRVHLSQGRKRMRQLLEDDDG